MTSFSSFPPTMQGPDPAAEDVTKEVIRDLLAGSNKKEYRTVGSALLGTFFNVLGAPLEALGVKGAGSVGTDVFGQKSPENTRQLAYLLTHLMTTEQAKKAVDKHAEIEEKKLKSQFAIADKIEQSKVKLQEMQQEFASREAKASRDATSRENALDRNAKGTLQGQALEAQSAIEKEKSATQKQIAAQDNASKNAATFERGLSNFGQLAAQFFGIAKKAETEKYAADKGLEGEKVRADAVSGKTTPQASAMGQEAELTARAMGAQFAGAAKDTKGGGTGLIQKLVDIATEDRFSQAIHQGAPASEALKVSGQDLNKLVEESILQQGEGKIAEDLLGPQMDEAKGRVTKFADMTKGMDPFAGDVDAARHMMASANRFNSVLGDLQSNAAPIYQQKINDYRATMKYQEAINNLLESYAAQAGAPNVPPANVAALGGYGNVLFNKAKAKSKDTPEYQALVNKYSIKNQFDPTAAKKLYDSLSAELQKK